MNSQLNPAARDCVEAPPTQLPLIAARRRTRNPAWSEMPILHTLCWINNLGRINKAE
jgi:hypothetical protein